MGIGRRFMGLRRQSAVHGRRFAGLGRPRFRRLFGRFGIAKLAIVLLPFELPLQIFLFGMEPSLQGLQTGRPFGRSLLRAGRGYFPEPCTILRSWFRSVSNWLLSFSNSDCFDSNSDCFDSNSAERVLRLSDCAWS